MSFELGAPAGLLSTVEKRGMIHAEAPFAFQQQIGQRQIGMPDRYIGSRALAPFSCSIARLLIWATRRAGPPPL